MLREHWDPDGQARRARLWPNEAQLRAVAEQAAKEAGPDLILDGPYRWGSPGMPTARLCLEESYPLPHHLVLYIGVEREFRGLMSSTAILIDERGPSCVWIGSANDEG